MTKRRKLSDVVNQELTEPTPAAVEPELKKSKSKSKFKSEPKIVPHYLTLVRKETRLKEEQFDELSQLSRKLNRQRKSTGDRITENTLIRVAIDLLLSQSNKLEGKTENELRESLGLPPDE